VVEDKRPKKAAPAPGADDADIEVEGVEDVEDEEVLEDAGELEDDADAIGGDIEVETDGEADEH
jgi:hypothetical protein